jgi:uncharacterized membrane protein
MGAIMTSHIGVANTKSAGQVVSLYNKELAKPHFWRDMFLYFWIFSLIGHIVEIAWAVFGMIFGLTFTPVLSTIPIFAIAAPYGLGAVALLILVYPMVKYKKISFGWSYWLSVMIATVIEFVSAVLLVIFMGHNYFWDYSDRFMNLFGFVCLGNSLLFGVISVMALWLLFPRTEKLRQKISEQYLNISFWILFVGYVLVQIVHWTKGWTS